MLFRYVIKRILIFIPTLIAISLAIFMLDKYMPGDPVLRGMNMNINNQDAINEDTYTKRWKSFNLNYPNFYLTFTSKYQPDTLYKIPQKYKKELLQNLVDKTYNWDATQSYFKGIEQFDKSVNSITKDSINTNGLIAIKKSIATLYRKANKNDIEYQLKNIQKTIDETPALQVLKTDFKNLKTGYQFYLDTPTPQKKYIPSLRWNGTQNQYHIWIFGNQPWVKKTEVLKSILKKPLSLKPIKEQITAPETGYYQVQPDIKLLENNGKVGRRALTTKKIFEIGVNRNLKKYTSEELAKTEFIVYAEKGELVSMTLNATNYTTYNQLKYEYNLEIERLLNYDPAKRSKGFIRLDFGQNFQLRPVSDVIKGGIFWTMILSLLSIILTYIIAIPIGVYSARYKGSKSDNIISTFLFMLYSLPNFWIATLLIIFVCAGLGWFPVFGLGDIPDNATTFEIFQIRAYQLIVPLFCWTYPTLAFLSRQMRGGMLNTLGQDFIRTARAKGLEEDVVIWKHGFRNSLLPIITIFASVFPRMISGSIVIEVIFGIPGLGRIMLEAIYNSDFPTVFTIVMMTALLTMIGYLVADILYRFADPRIRY